MAASYGAPGVYVEEKPSGSMPVQGVGTAVAAFVGFTELYRPDAGDPTDPDGVKPQLVTSWPQYERVYGGFAPGIKLPHAVKGFFENGGGICYIVRIPTEGGNGRLPQRALPAAGRHEIETLVVESRHADARLDVVIEGAPPVEGQEQASPEFTLKVVQDGAVKEEYGGLTIGRGQRGVDRVVNERSKLIQVQVQTVTGLSLADRVPAPGRYSIVPAAPATISARPEAFEGSETARTGYQGLAIADDVTMVAIPDLVTVATNEDGSFDYEMYLAAQGKLVDWCENSRTRMAILDSPPGLNAAQVNCIRSFGANGIRIWGARTLASTDQSWRYINVRRLFIFIEESIRRGTQWVVFEPNDSDLWARVRRTVSSFLTGLWMQGALVGATPEQAFFILCDETNNPTSSVDEGKLVVDVGIAPVKPAEFVIFRISQWQGGASTAE